MRRLCHCGAVTRKVPCEKCSQRIKPKWSKRKDDYDFKWRKLSERFRDENPLCHDCYKNGVTEPSVEVHHVVPISQDRSRRLDVSNLVALCRSCHKARHRGEAGWKKIWDYENGLLCRKFSKMRHFQLHRGGSVPPTGGGTPPTGGVCQNGSAKMAVSKWQ